MLYYVYLKYYKLFFLEKKYTKTITFYNVYLYNLYTMYIFVIKTN